MDEIQVVMYESNAPENRFTLYGLNATIVAGHYMNASYRPELLMTSVEIYMHTIQVRFTFMLLIYIVACM